MNITLSPTPTWSDLLFLARLKLVLSLELREIQFLRCYKAAVHGRGSLTSWKTRDAVPWPTASSQVSLAEHRQGQHIFMYNKASATARHEKHSRVLQPLAQAELASTIPKRKNKTGTNKSAVHLYQVVDMCTCTDMSLLKAIQIPNPTKTHNRRVHQQNKCCCIHYTNFRLICYFPRGTHESWRPKCNQYPFTSLCTSASVERLLIDAFILADNNNLNYFSFSFHPSLQYM